MVESVSRIVFSSDMADFAYHRQIFPNYAASGRHVSKDSAFAKIRARRSALNAIQLPDNPE